MGGSLVIMMFEFILDVYTHLDHNNVFNDDDHKKCRTGREGRRRVSRSREKIDKKRGFWAAQVYNKHAQAYNKHAEVYNKRAQVCTQVQTHVNTSTGIQQARSSRNSIKQACSRKHKHGYTTSTLKYKQYTTSMLNFTHCVLDTSANSKCITNRLKNIRNAHTRSPQTIPQK